MAWRSHPILFHLATISAPPIPLIPPIHEPHDIWLQAIAHLGKTAQQNARTIVSQHNRKNAQKAIAKFQKLITTKPKQGNKAIFQNSTNPPLNSLLDTHNNIITHPTDIADEIFIQQSAVNAPTVTNCNHQSQHSSTCTCQVRQYPWHDLNGFILQKRGNPQITISSLFTRATYNLCLKHLSKNKTPGPDQIPNSILKICPPDSIIYSFFFSPIATNSNPFHYHGKIVIPSYYTKRTPVPLGGFTPLKFL